MTAAAHSAPHHHGPPFFGGGLGAAARATRRFGECHPTARSVARGIGDSIVFCRDVGTPCQWMMMISVCHDPRWALNTFRVQSTIQSIRRFNRFRENGLNQLNRVPPIPPIESSMIPFNAAVCDAARKLDDEDEEG